MKTLNKATEAGLTNRELESLDLDTFATKLTDHQKTKFSELATEDHKNLVTKFNDIQLKYTEIQNKYDEDIANISKEAEAKVLKFQKDSLIDSELSKVDWADKDTIDVNVNYVKTKMNEYEFDLDGKLKSKDGTAAPHPFATGKTISTVKELISEIAVAKKMVRKNNAGGAPPITSGESEKPLSAHAQRLKDQADQVKKARG
jgi:hypothetical protein